MADNYPEELREIGEAALLLVSLKYSVFDDNTTRTLKTLKDQFSGRIKIGGENPVVENEAVPRNLPLPALPQRGGENPVVENEAVPRNLPLPALPQFELPIPAWNPPEFPPVARLNGLIGNCSKPFEKQLTDSDVRVDQCRLSINKADAENYLLPLLNPEENLEKGIPVFMYDSEGEEYQMMFKIWASKFHVLTGEWIRFCHQNDLQKIRDFVTLWMFRHAGTEKLCFVITSRRLNVNALIKRRRIIH